MCVASNGKIAWVSRWGFFRRKFLQEKRNGLGKNYFGDSEEHVHGEMFFKKFSECWKCKIIGVQLESKPRTGMYQSVGLGCRAELRGGETNMT